MNSLKNKINASVYDSPYHAMEFSMWKSLDGFVETSMTRPVDSSVTSSVWKNVMRPMRRSGSAALRAKLNEYEFGQ